MQIDLTIQKELIFKAKLALKNSYSPYSNFKVGAALLTSNQEIITGTNIENRYFNLTICAERTAIVKALSQGINNFLAIGLASKNQDQTIQYNCYPCGVCREFLHEFTPNIMVILETAANQIKTINLCELLPQD